LAKSLCAEIHNRFLYINDPIYILHNGDFIIGPYGPEYNPIDAR
ncbi:unnamed protein product, partial [Adineta steineri]